MMKIGFLSIQYRLKQHICQCGFGRTLILPRKSNLTRKKLHDFFPHENTYKTPTKEIRVFLHVFNPNGNYGNVHTCIFTQKFREINLFIEFSATLRQELPGCG